MFNKKAQLQFELEQKIFHCWNLVDDINIVVEASKTQEITPEQATKVLEGLADFYTLKFQALQRVFEQYTAIQYPKQDNDAY